MTRFEATEARDRLGLAVDAITAHRLRDSEGVTFESDEGRVEYADRTLTLTVEPDERERLDALLEEFPVFKIEQPATRKAPEGVVHVSAIADPKHAADFVDACFRSVFEAEADYELRVVRV
jgi:hypothetical protein